MNEIVNHLVLLPRIWRFCIFLLMSILVAYSIYQYFLKLQIIQIQQQQGQLQQLESRLKNYLHNRNEMFSKRELFAQQNQVLVRLDKIIKAFNRKAPEYSMLQAAIKTDVKPQEVQISAESADEFGRFYLVQITIKSDLYRISKFLNYLISQAEFAVWEQLIITRNRDDSSLNLSARYYFELFDETES